VKIFVPSAKNVDLRLERGPKEGCKNFEERGMLGGNKRKQSTVRGKSQCGMDWKATVKINIAGRSVQEGRYQQNITASSCALS